jgi:hypothetical protein
MQRWTQEYAEWTKWYAKWRNRPEPGVFSTRARRPRPIPPEWLSTECVNVLEEEGPLVDACRAWRDWSRNDDGAGLLLRQQARTNKEAPRKTIWWERIHVDALWPMTQAGVSGLGVAGLHTTMHVTDRFQVFLVPGAILMRLPSLDGRQTWSAATDWGFSYSLFDIRMPGMRRSSTVHFNFVRVWVLGSSPVKIPGELYLAGLSLSFKQR